MFALIMLTALDGSPVWVESSAVVIVRPALQQCKHVEGSGIRIGTVSLCVREAPEQIQKKIEGVR